MGFQLQYLSQPQLVSFLPGFLKASTGISGRFGIAQLGVGDFQLAIPMCDSPPAAPLGTNLVGAGGLATGAPRCCAQFFVQEDRSFRN